MKFLKISFLFFSFLFFMTSCSKEKASKEFTFEQKEFVVSDSDKATYLVQTFIASVPNNNTADLRTSYPDTDINEGRWILEASGNYEKNVNFPGNIRSDVRPQVIEINNVTVNGETLLDGTDMTLKFANMLATAEVGRQGTELVAGFDVKILEVKATSAKFNVSTFYVVPPPVPYNCAGVPDNPPNPVVNTNIFFISSNTLACLNQGISADNQSTIANIQACQSSLWIPDLFTVSVHGDYFFADMVIDEEGRKCSSLGECLLSRPELYPTLDITWTVKQYVEDQVRIAVDIVHDIENEIAPPPGTANNPSMFVFDVNLWTDPEDNPSTDVPTLYMEIRDVVFAKYLIACN